MFKDLMVDLETLGTTPSCPIISVGAVFFNVETKILGPSFYMVADVSEQIEGGRKISGDTLKWWMQQSDAAKKVFHEKAKPLGEVLRIFSQWYKANAHTSGAFVWGNGATFDISILENAFQDYKMVCPWKFYKVMDLRTYKRFVRGGEAIKKSGVNHNALDDAISQAKYVIEAVQ